MSADAVIEDSLAVEVDVRWADHRHFGTIGRVIDLAHSLCPPPNSARPVCGRTQPACVCRARGLILAHMIESRKCPRCGILNFSGETNCKRCDADLSASTIDSASSFYAPPTVAAPSTVNRPPGRLIRSVLAGLIALVVGFYLSGVIFSHWEYQTVSFYAEGSDRTGDAAAKYAAIAIDEDRLALLGGQGWELSASWLEMETAYPNFGSSEYVTGLQPNVRPQRAVMVFKRRAPWWHRVRPKASS